MCVYYLQLNRFFIFLYMYHTITNNAIFATSNKSARLLGTVPFVCPCRSIDLDQTTYICMELHLLKIIHLSYTIVMCLLSTRGNMYP